MQQIIYSILPIFLLIVLGFIAQKVINLRHPIVTFFSKKGIIPQNGWTDVLNQYALYIALPSLILYSLLSTPLNNAISNQIISFTLISSFVFIALLFLVIKLFNIKKQFASTLLLCGYLGNIAYIGFPYLSAIIKGSEPTISIIIGIHITISFTFILYLLEKHLAGNVSPLHIFKKLIAQPLLIAVVVGVLFSITNFSLHPVILETINMIAKSASPTVLIALGAFFAKSWSAPKHPFQVVLLTFVKLLAFPLVSFFIAYGWYDISKVTLPLLESTMPIAITSFALSHRYHLDKQTIGYAIILSTILSFVTITVFSGIVL